MKQIYMIKNYSDAIRSSAGPAFSSFIKALNYILQQGTITHIKDEPTNKYWEGSWSYSDYYTPKQWAKILRDKTKAPIRKYMTKRDCYGIKIIEVL